MRVDALRALLAEVPGDWLVTIDDYHVEYLRRAFEKVGPRLHTVPVKCEECGQEHRHWSGEPHVRYLPALALHTRRHNKNDRSQPEPPIQFYGRWTAAQRAVIDRFSTDPDAAHPGRPSAPPLCPTCDDVHWGATDFEYACKDPFHQTGQASPSGRTP